MTTDFTPTVPPFEVSTPFGVCTVTDIRVPNEGKHYARVSFDKTLKVNGKTYDTRVDFTVEPMTGQYHRLNEVYRVSQEYGGYTGGLTDNARNKVVEYLSGPEVLKALTRIGLLSPVDPAEVRAYRRERVYYGVTSALYDLLYKGDYNLPPAERDAAIALREELVEEVILRVASRRLDGMTWKDIANRKYADD